MWVDHDSVGSLVGYKEVWTSDADPLGKTGNLWKVIILMSQPFFFYNSLEISTLFYLYATFQTLKTVSSRQGGGVKLENSNNVYSFMKKTWHLQLKEKGGTFWRHPGSPGRNDALLSLEGIGIVLKFLGDHVFYAPSLESMMVLKVHVPQPRNTRAESFTWESSCGHVCGQKSWMLIETRRWSSLGVASFPRQ